MWLLKTQQCLFRKEKNLKQLINIFPNDSKSTWNLNEQFLLQSIIQCIKIIIWVQAILIFALAFKHLMRLFHPHSINTTKTSFRFTRWFLYLFDELADPGRQKISVCWPAHWRLWIFILTLADICLLANSLETLGLSSGPSVVLRSGWMALRGRPGEGCRWGILAWKLWRFRSHMTFTSSIFFNTFWTTV